MYTDRGANFRPSQADPDGVRADLHDREAARLGAELRERTAEVARLAQELERSRAHFRDVIERNADAILVVDRDGVIRFANRAAVELFRYRREDLLGTTFGFPISLGETTELDLFCNGAAHVAEMRVVESEWEGEAAYIASLRDITERKRAEEGARRLIGEKSARTAAEAAARRFKFLAEASNVLALPLDFAGTLAALAELCVQEVADWSVVYVLDEEGKLERLEVAHCEPGMGETVEALRDHPIPSGGLRMVQDVIRSGTPRLIEDVDEAMLAEIADDERHRELLDRLGVASLMILPLVARGRGIGAIALVAAERRKRFTEEDISAAKDLAARAALAVDNARLYRAAQEANQAKSDVLAVISHDLRTPLSSIMGYAELLAMGLSDKLSAASLERVERIRLSATHVLFLIDELLSFARLEAGQQELRIRAVDAHALVREVAAVIEPMANERGLALRVDLAGPAVTLDTDADRLRQVLLNLVGNAVKYTDEGEVRIDAAGGPDGSVVFQVIDTGAGIPEEHVERIFEPFWQIQAGSSPKGGTGLGLSVVRRMIRLLGGSVSVQSALGRGSTFTVRLPAAPPS